MKLDHLWTKIIASCSIARALRIGSRIGAVPLLPATHWDTTAEATLCSVRFLKGIKQEHRATITFPLLQAH